ncbi:MULTISPECIES: MFS transporter [Xanthomonas]|uniref:MFS transporter n=1 Tax=Xanthomonas TaxID=338 RepID=UPI000A4ACC3D|nr:MULTISPECIES: MFS transporter [Xanthomonas]
MNALASLDLKMPLSPWRMRFFATALGLLVANLYYLHPMLTQVAASFGIGTTQAGYLVTCTQMGYALGVLLIVPLGDIYSRRTLASWMLVFNVIGLLTCAVSPDFLTFATFSILVGVCSSAAMVVVPYIAEKAPQASRGRLVGQAMTGLLLGILLARTAAGFIADTFGWRWVFALAGLAMAVLFAGLRSSMEPSAGHIKLRYGRLLASLWSLLRDEPELRRRALFAFLGMGSFSVLWTGLTFLLSSPPYAYPPATIGLFGLVGAAGALTANISGRLGDKGYAREMTGLFAGLMVIAWACLSWGAASLWAVVGGVLVLDIATQGLQVTNQSVIYGIVPEARSRVTAIFVTSAFIGMSAGSALASTGYTLWGWAGLCLVGAALPLGLLAVWSNPFICAALRRQKP